MEIAQQIIFQIMSPQTTHLSNKNKLEDELRQLLFDFPKKRSL